MSIHSIRSQRNCDLLLMANHQLEKIYFQQQMPCLALHISQNYYQLQKQDANIRKQKQWQEKARSWWELYWEERSNSKSNPQYQLFFDAYH